MAQFSRLRGKTVLITGGAGFIGSNLSDFILAHGGRVVCLDDLSTGSLRNIEEARRNTRFIFIKGNANVSADMQKAFAAGRLIMFSIMPRSGRHPHHRKALGGFGGFGRHQKHFGIVQKK